MNGVLRKMLKETLMNAIDVLVRQYINKKALGYKGEGSETIDPLDGPIIDPITLMGK